jgi:hypothetical protein
MTACGYVDDAIATFSRASVIEARARKIPLRHAVFSEAFVMHREAAISQLINFIHSEALSIRSQEDFEFGLAIRSAWSHAVTFGQFYFLIGIMKFSRYAKEGVPHVARLMPNVTAYPYHLQLDLINFCGYLRDAEDPYRSQIVEALQASLDKLGVMMNAVIIEALQGLGMLEEDEHNHVPVIQREIEEVLSANDSKSDQIAWEFFSRQFDHPFEASYWEEIQALEDSRRKLFLTKACRGASAPYLLFFGMLIQQLSEFNDPEVAPALARWTTLPDKQSFIPQNAIEIFVIAHEALGRLGAPLPQSRGEPKTAAEHALLACGALYYWSNRADVENAQTSRHTLEARTVLLDHSLFAGAAALQLTTSCLPSGNGKRELLVKNYPDITLEICREAIKRPNEQVSYFQHGFKDDAASIAKFSIQVLAALGNESDLLLLKDLCDHEQHGVSALDAIKKIEGRVSDLCG